MPKFNPVTLSLTPEGLTQHPAIYSYLLLCKHYLENPQPVEPKAHAWNKQALYDFARDFTVDNESLRQQVHDNLAEIERIIHHKIDGPNITSDSCDTSLLARFICSAGAGQNLISVLTNMACGHLSLRGQPIGYESEHREGSTSIMRWEKENLFATPSSKEVNWTLTKNHCAADIKLKFYLAQYSPDNPRHNQNDYGMAFNKEKEKLVTVSFDEYDILKRNSELMQQTLHPLLTIHARFVVSNGLTDSGNSCIQAHFEAVNMTVANPDFFGFLNVKDTCPRPSKFPRSKSAGFFSPTSPVAVFAHERGFDRRRRDAGLIPPAYQAETKEIVVEYARSDAQELNPKNFAGYNSWFNLHPMDDYLTIRRSMKGNNTPVIIAYKQNPFGERVLSAAAKVAQSRSLSSVSNLNQLKDSLTHLKQLYETLQKNFHDHADHIIETIPGYAEQEFNPGPRALDACDLTVAQLYAAYTLLLFPSKCSELRPNVVDPQVKPLVQYHTDRSIKGNALARQQAEEGLVIVKHLIEHYVGNKERGPDLHYKHRLYQINDQYVLTPPCVVSKQSIQSFQEGTSQFDGFDMPLASLLEAAKHYKLFAEEGVHFIIPVVNENSSPHIKDPPHINDCGILTFTVEPSSTEKHAQVINATFEQIAKGGSRVTSVLHSICCQAFEKVFRKNIQCNLALVDCMDKGYLATIGLLIQLTHHINQVQSTDRQRIDCTQWTDVIYQAVSCVLTLPLSADILYPGEHDVTSLCHTYFSNDSQKEAVQKIAEQLAALKQGIKDYHQIMTRSEEEVDKNFKLVAAAAQSTQISPKELSDQLEETRLIADKLKKQLDTLSRQNQALAVENSVLKSQLPAVEKPDSLISGIMHELAALALETDTKGDYSSSMP